MSIELPSDSSSPSSSSSNNEVSSMIDTSHNQAESIQQQGSLFIGLINSVLSRMGIVGQVIATAANYLIKKRNSSNQSQ